ALAAVCAAALAACGSTTKKTTGSAGSDATVTLNGGGSTFAAPIYQQVASNLKSRGLTVNYQPIGSGARISQLQARTLEVAAPAPALKPADAAKIAKTSVPIQVPFALGAITVSYNLPNVKSGLKLDGATIAGIFLGKITKWNDPAIATLNPGMTLPSTAITVV